MARVDYVLKIDGIRAKARTHSTRTRSVIVTESPSPPFTIDSATFTLDLTLEMN